MPETARPNPLLAWRPWAVAAAAATLFLANLGGSHLWDDDEPKNARCGVEMLQSGDWVVPMFNGALRSHKPVLLYWAMIASYATLGVSEFAARLPSALAGVAVVVMAYHLGRLLFDRTTGLLAAALLLSALMFAVLSRAATPDGVLMVGTTAALLAFVAGVSRQRGGHFSGLGASGEAPPLARIQLPWPHAIAMYVAMGWAVLAKGPIGLVVPLLAVVLYGLFGEPAGVAVGPGPGRWRRLTRWFAASVAPGRWLSGARSIRLLSGLAIVAAVAGPWYVLVSLRTEGAWLAGFVGTHNVGRFMNAMEGHDGPFYYYAVAILAGFFPASCFLPVALAGGVKGRVDEAPLARSQAFALAYVFAWVGFFSIAATKLPNYVIPCYVGLALATAAWLVQTARLADAAGLKTLRSWLAAGMGSAVVAGVAIAGALAYVGGVLMAGPAAGGPAWIGLAGVLPVVGGLLGLSLLHRGQSRRAVAAFAACGVAFTLVGTSVVGPTASPYADGPRLAEVVRTLEAARGEPLRFATHRYTVPTLVWELDRTSPGLDAEAAREWLADPAAVIAMRAEAYEALRPTLPAGVGPLAEEGRFLRTEKRVVLIGHQTLVAEAPGGTNR